MRSRREMDAWEALDVDDSDLGSLLRPCKRQVSTISSSSGSPQPVVGSHPPASTTSSPLIPGPAGALQAAFMQRKTHLHSPLPTQDYLRRVAQEGFPDDDHDFKHHHWLLALDFVRRQGNHFFYLSFRIFYYSWIGILKKIYIYFLSSLPPSLSFLQVLSRKHLWVLWGNALLLTGFLWYFQTSIFLFLFHHCQLG